MGLLFRRDDQACLVRYKGLWQMWKIVEATFTTRCDDITPLPHAELSSWKIGHVTALAAQAQSLHSEHAQRNLYLNLDEQADWDVNVTGSFHIDTE